MSCVPPLPSGADSNFARLPLINKVPKDIEFQYLFYRAIRERQIAAEGAHYFPRQNIQLYNGTVNTITSGYLTDPSGSFTTFHRCGLVVNPSNAYIAIYSKDDPRYVAKANITSTSGTTIFFTPTDWTERGICPNYSSLVGSEYEIFEQGDICRYDRWFESPNAWEYVAYDTQTRDSDDNEIFRPGSHLTHSSGTYIRDVNQSWFANQFAIPQSGYPDQPNTFDLVIYDSTDNLVHRMPINSNTPDRINFAQQGSYTPTSGSYYSIIKRGAYWNPQSTTYGRKTWYRGSSEDYLAHLPDDSIGDAIIPVSQVFFDDGTFVFDDSECLGPTGHDAFVSMTNNEDVWDDCCNPNCCDHANANRNYSPDFYKTVRALQLTIEGMCGFPWIVPETIDGTSYGPRTLTFPFAAKWANDNLGSGIISSFSTSISSVTSGNAYIGITPPYLPISLHYTVLDSDGLEIGDSISAVQHNNIGYYISGSWGSGNVGNTLQCTWGWSRYYDYEFEYMYGPKTVFIPNLDDDDNPVDPPIASGNLIGNWISRPKSSGYNTFDQGLGILGSNGINFASGDLSRYVGQNATDPNISPVVNYRSSVINPLAPYHNHFYTGTLSKNAINPGYKKVDSNGPDYTSNSLNAYKTTDGKVTQISPSGAVFNFYWYTGDISNESNGVLIAHSGVTTGGSATTLIDSSKIGNPFWSSGRFDQGFTVEYQPSSGVVYHHLITGINPSTGTLTVQKIDGVTIQSGKGYQIKEPKYELNRYINHPIEIFTPSGSYLTSIRANDHTTLFINPLDDFALSSGILSRVSLRVENRQTGGVYKYDPSQVIQPWTIPTGQDHRTDPNTGLKPYFHQNINENLTYHFDRYGAMCKGDYYGPWIFNQMWAILKSMIWTRGSPSCTNDHGSGPENNGIGFAAGTFDFEQIYNTPSPYPFPDTQPADCQGSDAGQGYDTAFGAWQASIDAIWPPFDGFPGDGICPQAILTNVVTNVSSGPAGCYVGFVTSFDVERFYAYLKDNGIPICMNSQVDWVAYGQIDPTNTPEGITQNYFDDPTKCGGYHRNKFDSQGTPLQYHKWATVGTSSISDTDTRISDKVGNANTDPPIFTKPPDPAAAALVVCPANDTIPGDCESPPADPAILSAWFNMVTCGASEYTGYYAGQIVAIRKWNVSGGFQYI